MKKKILMILVLMALLCAGCRSSSKATMEDFEKVMANHSLQTEGSVDDIENAEEKADLLEYEYANGPSTRVTYRIYKDAESAKKWWQKNLDEASGMEDVNIKHSDYGFNYRTDSIYYRSDYKDNTVLIGMRMKAGNTSLFIGEVNNIFEEMGF